jgi:hypothetical protein
MGALKEGDCLEDLDVSGRIVLKSILKIVWMHVGCTNLV